MFPLFYDGGKRVKNHVFNEVHTLKTQNCVSLIKDESLFIF